MGNQWVGQVLPWLLGILAVGAIQLSFTCFEKQIRRLLVHLLPEIHPWANEPIAEQDLPNHVRRYFQAVGPEFLAEGFRKLEDVVLQRVPERSWASYYLSPDEEILGCVVCHRGVKTFSCISLASDGVYLETSVIKFGPPPPPESNLRFFRAPGSTVAAAIAHHREQMAAYAEASGAELVLIDFEGWRMVVDHGHKLVARDAFKRGHIAKLPEFAREGARAVAG
jgi:hypothetical protein